MSKNKFMHKRNIYRRGPDFTQLAIKYPEFLKVCTLDLNGSAHVDFKNPDTLRILTTCLLKRDFQLDVEIPQGKLVPTLPLRLNYILWIEDILAKINITDAVGLDIGCGASCVYPLLGVKWKNWRMYGTDITEEIVNNEDSVKFIIEKLRKILTDLEISIEILEETLTKVNWIVRAQINTWSHQRRKRRQMQQKKPTEEESQSPEKKRIRLDGKSILVAEVFLIPRDNQVKLELVYLDGELGRDGVHQVLQYIMNNWRKNDLH
uniref:U6 small nuclear RNA (adenine-(43)-N(6))-methyltransferase n=1 Tax=Phlebotomus papatasi TaxID=29031 RepID=A0A1B0DCG1_PHLPP